MKWSKSRGFGISISRWRESSGARDGMLESKLAFGGIPLSERAGETGLYHLLVYGREWSVSGMPQRHYKYGVPGRTIRRFPACDRDVNRDAMFA